MMFFYMSESYASCQGWVRVPVLSQSVYQKKRPISLHITSEYLEAPRHLGLKHMRGIVPAAHSLQKRLVRGTIALDWILASVRMVHIHPRIVGAHLLRGSYHVAEEVQAGSPHQSLVEGVAPCEGCIEKDESVSTGVEGQVKHVSTLVG